MADAATLNGHLVTAARVKLPFWGCWNARAALDRGELLEGQVTLTIGGLTLVGTVVPGRGGVFNDAASYVIVGGFGGWAKEIPETSYQGPLVRLSTIVGDAARAAGERVVVDPAADRVVGPYMRFRGPASQVLQQLAPRAWWVDLDGTTHVGVRPGGVIDAEPLNVDVERAVAHLALEELSSLLPGATLVSDGRAAGDVVHVLDGVSLRSELWLQEGDARLARSFRGLLEEYERRARYRGVHEFRVVSQSGDLYELQPTDPRAGIGPTRATARPGIAGARVELEPGAHVLVAFVGGDPARPFVAAFPGTAEPGSTPAKVYLDAGEILAGAGAASVIRDGDTVAVAAGGGVISLVEGTAETPPAASRLKG